ncbi:hypothetical protein [Cryptosporangium phraense]|uniref:Uncharacterized protein n=1 Tax=Cryptosporangium phraense TaxID=2593070 RepID=A0A545ASK5_9ACTN|nr:hypothetical protein [Cryptosporangium phraense]TQS44322.1 hypothetical protein FL583_15430 [Cryptosporangium phraense]
MKVALTVLVFVFVLGGTTALGDLLSEEIRGRLDRLPFAVLRLAARRVPQPTRAERVREWEGELYEVLRGAEALPVTRLWKGVRYSFGLVYAAPAITAALELKPVSTPPARGARTPHVTPESRRSVLTVMDILISTSVAIMAIIVVFLGIWQTLS